MGFFSQAWATLQKVARPNGLDVDWNVIDDHIARQDGWYIGTLNGKLILCGVQEEYGPFPYPEQVWRHVGERAEWGDPICAKALNYLRQKGPEEFLLIDRYLTSGLYP